MVLHAVWTCLISVWKYQTDKIGVLRDFQRYVISDFKRLQQFRILHEHCILETFNLQKNGIKDL
jgi:hypothetical protein